MDGFFTDAEKLTIYNRAFDTVSKVKDADLHKRMSAVVDELHAVNHKYSRLLDEMRVCKHSRCKKYAKSIGVLDDHDSNAGTYYLINFCSLECFVCELKHRADDKDLVDFVQTEVWS
jgi:hypothetical protein